MNTYRKLIINAGLTTAALLALSACGGGGGSTANIDIPVQGSISGVATKGPMNNAMVTAYGIVAGQTGVPIATTSTDATGNFSMNIGSYSGAVMLQVSGGSYIDEATGVSMPMGVGDVMTALLPTVKAGASNSGIQVTPLTAMAQSMAQNMKGGMTDANIALANSAMGANFSVSDILHVAPMNPLLPGSGSGASQDAQNYGMTLAAMTKYAQTMGMSSSSAIVTAMMNDASDGVLDGKAGSTPISMSMGGMMGTSTMPASAGSANLATAMTDFMSSQMNASGLTPTSMAAMLQKLASSSGKI